MTEHNLIQLVYNPEHKPYLYGAVLVGDGDLDKQMIHGPFIISKRMPGGAEVIYGSVMRILEKIDSQMKQIQEF